MLLSSDVRQNATGHQLDSREAQKQIEQSLELQTTLADTAQKQNARLKDEPAPAELTALAQMKHTIEVVQATSAGGSAGDGGQGQATAYSEPHLKLSSPAGIAATTPASAIVAAGATTSITAGQDINFASQGNAFNLVKNGISLFTYGKAESPEKPNQETGIKLHAATGKVSVQSQADVTKITADKAITVASVTKAVTVGAKEHVMLTVQGAYLKLEGGNIMIHGPGKMMFKGGMKELTGPASTPVTLPALPKTGDIDNYMELNYRWDDMQPMVGAPYKVLFDNGTSIAGNSMRTDSPGWRTFLPAVAWSCMARTNGMRCRASR